MYKIGVCIIIASIVVAESAPGEYVGGGQAQFSGNVSVNFKEYLQLILNP